MKSPSFPFYPSDFIGSTTCMTAEEVGIYVRLLCHQWSAGSIPNDDRMLRRIAGEMAEPSALLVAKAKFKPCDDGNLRNERLESIRSDREAFLSERARSGAKGAVSRWNKVAKPIAEPLAEPSNSQWQNDGLPSPSPIPSPIPTPKPINTGGGKPLNMDGDVGDEKIRRANDARVIIHLLNEKTGASFRELPTSMEPIMARLAEPGVTLKDCIAVVERQCAMWLGQDMAKYLRPETLFGKKKFEGYYAARNLAIPRDTVLPNGKPVPTKTRHWADIEADKDFAAVQKLIAEEQNEGNQ